MRRASLTRSCLGAHHDGFLRRALADAHGHLQAEFVKVKAHQTDKDFIGPMSAQAVHNNEVDVLAKRGAKLHGGPSEAEQKEADRKAETAKQVYRCMAAVLPLWPTMSSQLKGERLERAPTVATNRMCKPRPAAVPEEQRHHWTQTARGWRCTRCHTVATTTANRRRRSEVETCCGKCQALSQVVDDPKGHKLRALAIEGTATLLCITCGCHASKWVKGLAEPCKGKPACKGQEALKRYSEGKHPEVRSEALYTTDVALYEEADEEVCDADVFEDLPEGEGAKEALDDVGLLGLGIPGSS